MTKVKIYLLLGVVFIALCGTLGYQHNKINTLAQEKEVYRSNTNSLLSAVELYQIDSTLKAGSIQALQLTIEEYQTYKAEDAAIIDKLRLKVKQLESASKTNINIDAPIISPVIDSIYIYQDTTISHIQKVEMNNDYIHFNGAIKNDTLQAQINIPITLHQFVYHEYKHKFLWFKWGVGTIHQVITTDNPYVNIKYTEYIKLSK